MNSFVFSFQEIDKTKFNVVGGKGANLGELSKIEGIHVPDGFCISTEAYKKIIAETSSINELLNLLSNLKAEERDKILALSTEIRSAIEAIKIPEHIVEEISQHISRLGEKNAYAIRSSATAEDLPTASFAGQQDTYLNVIGKASILKHISKCWASLFTERAIIYRIQNGFDHRKVYLSVVIQKMIFPQASGIVFTADPINGNRKILSIDASFGLGEALVSGIVNADNYKVQTGAIINKKISTKKIVVRAANDGGTKEEAINVSEQNEQALSNEQILQLEIIGRKIEKHFGVPQDIEWCLADEIFYVVQSRPITTLFPIPEVNDDTNHVYISVGHQQMMTDAMKPLGISMWQLVAGAPMYKAAGRLFVDVAHQLSSANSRTMLLKMMEQHDPLIKDALNTIIERGNFIQMLADDEQAKTSHRPLQGFNTLKDFDPAIVSELIKRSETEIEELKQNIKTKSGLELIDFILEHIEQSKKSRTDPQSFGVIMTPMNAASWLNEKMNEWLNEKNVADKLSQSLSNNITSEMGLALLDVADKIRPYSDVINYLQHVKDENFLDELPKFAGGAEVHNAINRFLTKYGMRCAGEIDITKPRWSEKPTTLLPMILSNIKKFEPGESKRKFDKGLQEVLKKEQQLLEKLKQLPDGEQKVKETKKMIALVRNFAGYREYPKYDIISRHFVYKQALLKEAKLLLNANIIHEKEDVYYLTFEELREVIQTNKVDHQLISKRKEEFKFFEKLTPPRVITSDGEIVTGTYKRENLPANAIIGLPVSSGVVEGRARVILDMHDANLEDGDILVTRFTDPSWTPLFISIKALITEVGGLMTHGAVIAREYGLPAVVGVENATELIRDGQRIRIHGTDGYIEIL
ncbi:MAG TPA: phosphoenolpyruvate synthase [Parafilimonas sp.]|nr:phosphoenolpyruvate synthase [Parafilimonas sp.]